MDEWDKWRSVRYGRAHIVHFFTYLTSPRAVYSLYHDNYSMRLLVA